MLVYAGVCVYALISKKKEEKKEREREREKKGRLIDFEMLSSI